MENGALSNIIKPSRFGCFPEPLVAMYISQARHPLLGTWRVQGHVGMA